MQIDTQHFKEKLETELKQLEAQLPDVARKNPNDPEDWEAKGSDFDTNPAEEGEKGTYIEETKENEAVANDLERRYADVVRALKKIDEGTYGVCEITGQPIEIDRLEANPAARACKEHMNDESSLPA